MARFDVHARRDGPGYLLDYQSDLLGDLNTRFVVPLLVEAEAPRPAARLNPVFLIEGERVVMATQFAAAIAIREMGPHIGSLREQADAIGNALDMLICGF